LSLIDRLPAGIERDKAELELQVALGFSLIAVRGWAASEVMDALARVRELGAVVRRTAGAT
jgi:hypothetical protein